MNNNKVQIEIKKRLQACLEKNHILGALNELEAMILSMSLPWTYKDALESLRQRYGYLYEYAIGGAEDPERENQMSDIKADISQLVDSITRYSLMADSPSLYFNKLRYENSQGDSGIGGLLTKFKSEYGKLSMNRFMSRNLSNNDLERVEALERRAFDVVWTTFPYSRDDESAIMSLIDDETVPDYFVELVLSGVMLGAMAYYDERRLLILGRYYLNGKERIAIRALCGMLLVMWVNRNRQYGRRFCRLFEAIVEQKSWESDFKMVFMHMVRSHDTDRITRTMNEEIIPQLMKMRPGISKMMTKTDIPEDLLSLDENPEWTEMFEKSGLADKLKELNEMQMQGGDVMMGTFSSLKSYPFFHEISNWFLPFSQEISCVGRVLGGMASDLGEMISSSDVLCDSDKYSILLTLEQMPASNRRMMVDQFQMQVNQMGELRSSLLNPEAQSRDSVAGRYIQDIYRFFKLFRRKGEFDSPFDAPINLPSVSMIGNNIHESESIRVASEFYFKHRYYDEAIDLMRLIDERGEADAQIYQKLGFCYQRKGEFVAALDMYGRSELLRPDSQWTLRHIAQCYRYVNEPAKALEYYKRLDSSRKDDVAVVLNIGHCYAETGDYENALKYYFKADFMRPDDVKIQRSIAWVLFLKSDFERSRIYYDKVFGLCATDADKINYGHLLMVTGDYTAALQYYKIVPVEYFIQSMDGDRRYLTDRNVDGLILDIVIDAVTSRVE